MASRTASGFIAATPSEPNPPALETAAASAGVLTPAMGAWMIGAVMPSRSRHARARSPTFAISLTFASLDH